MRRKIKFTSLMVGDFHPPPRVGGDTQHGAMTTTDKARVVAEMAAASASGKAGIHKSPSTASTVSTSVDDEEQPQQHQQRDWNRHQQKSSGDWDVPVERVSRSTDGDASAPVDDVDQTPGGHIGATTSTEAELWGRPGHLTEEEGGILERFRRVVESRGEDFRDSVYSFGEVEGEAHALCRWLRARQFNLEETVGMVELAMAERAEAKRHNFYPDPREALGVDPDLFNAQYPQLYTGRAKNGCPVFISKPGRLNVDAVECIATMDGILRYHWYAMMHDFANRLRRAKAADENFTRFECFCILDLDHLTTSQISQRALNITRTQTRIDSLCFPETMNRMIIVNAPRFFSMTWRIIRGWLDPRTAAKVEIISSRSAGERRLRELVDADQLPSDYGGRAEATTEILQRGTWVGGTPEYSEWDGVGGTVATPRTRRIIDLMRIRTHTSLPVDLRDGEVLQNVVVYTRSTNGARFEIVDSRGKVAVTNGGGVDVTHHGRGVDEENESPTSVALIGGPTSDRPRGPGRLKIRADSKGGRFQSDNFLIVCTVISAT